MVGLLKLDIPSSHIETGGIQVLGCFWPVQVSNPTITPTTTTTSATLDRAMNYNHNRIVVVIIIRILLLLLF